MFHVQQAIFSPLKTIRLHEEKRDGPLENLSGAGGGGVGAGEVQKKYSRKGKLNEKIFMLWPKKNSYKEFDNEKKIPAVRKFSFPP